MSEPIKVFVADDQNLFREMLVGILQREDDIVVVGEASDGREAVTKIKALQPDVVLVDINMPELNGIHVTEIVKKEYEKIKVVVLTGYSQEDYIFEALQRGASGYLSKDISADKVKEAIRTVFQGESLLEAKITTKLIREFVKIHTNGKEPVEGHEGSAGGPELMRDTPLTKREIEILKLIAKGMSNIEIAEKLFISEHTVKTHVGNLLRKLGISDRVQAVLYAVEKGIR
ncbi:MAG: response regulator transcription factor [Candidatus Eremiobacteraeota bacterium]|nr:response regulator transcription factor [Candidatus Eremiobacteraeota bacterium]